MLIRCFEYLPSSQWLSWKVLLTHGTPTAAKRILGQWFSTRGNFTPRRMLTISTDIFRSSQLEGECYWQLLGARDAAQHPPMHRTVPTTIKKSSPKGQYYGDWENLLYMTTNHNDCTGSLEMRLRNASVLQTILLTTEIIKNWQVWYELTV